MLVSLFVYNESLQGEVREVLVFLHKFISILLLVYISGSVILGADLSWSKGTSLKRHHLIYMGNVHQH